MTADAPTQRAYDLGMDHADDEHASQQDIRLRSGRDTARALGFTATSGKQLVDLRDAYNDGWRDWT